MKVVIERQWSSLLLLLLILALELISADAFSTISSSRIRASRPHLSLARGGGGSYARASVGRSSAEVENGHTNNYITTIEDVKSYQGARGLFVATTDHNYAIQSPALQHEQGWQSVTVNGDQVFVLTSANKTYSTKLSALSEQQRDFIAEARANFTQNLAGLRLAHYTSGSSTSLPSGNSLGSSGSGSGYGASSERPSVADLVIAQMVGPNSSNNLQWNEFVSSSSEAPPRPHEYQHAQGFGAEIAQTATAQPPPPPKFQTSKSETIIEANGLPSSATNFFSKRRSFAGTNQTDAQSTTTTSAPHQIEISSKKKTRSLPRYAQAPPPPPNSNIYGPTYDYNQQSAQPPTIYGDPLATKSSCSPARWLDSFNYYNLNAGSPLNKSLAGDVYFFDFQCNTLDVYSSSVSLRHSLGMSAIYRDADFFSFSRSNLPSAINRIFLVDKHVFLIYNDGSLLVKANWQLESYELNLIVQARNKLKLINGWQNRAANLMKN